VITGIFIDPSPELTAVLDARKAIARTQWPRAAYLDHPPHATLIAGAFGPADHWLPLLSDVLRAHETFVIETSGITVFANDPMTGGSTVAIAVAESAALRRLQSIVAAVLAPSRDPAAAEALARSMGDPRAAESARAFGSAWVGAHWRPHFTVASLPVAESHIPAALTKSVSPITMRVAVISVWRVDDAGIHTRVAAAPLATAGTAAG
jgi:hypothetical protein